MNQGVRSIGATPKALAANIDQLKDVGGLDRYVKMAKAQAKRSANILILKIQQADLKRLRELAEKKKSIPEALASQILYQYVGIIYINER